LITGGARGQGRSHALALAREGADIVLLDRCADFDSVGYPLASKDDLAESVALVEAEDRRCLARQADVRDPAQVQAVVDEAVSDFGRIDILLANAGVSAGLPIQIATSEMWDEVVGTNLTGVFNAMKAVAPVMIEQNYGRIVATSSMLGRFAMPSMAPYVASKWGVIGLVKTVAQDLAAFGVTVNAVAPGNIDTPMIRNEFLARTVRPDLANPTMEDVEKVLGALHVQPDPVLPASDVSAAILFLVGPGSLHMTGAVLDVSAGASARFTA
jgi:SDR family mycofactocin-dependent oxidoreductase